MTSDCPLISPTITGAVIRRYVSGSPRADYVSNTIQRTFPRGLDTEVLGIDVLLQADAEATAQADREHVTPFIWRQPERFHLVQVVDEIDRSHLRWTLDTPADYEFLRRVFSAAQSDVVEYEDILEMLEEHPDWVALNSHVRQKRYGE